MKNNSLWQVVSLALDLGYIIALPIVFLGFGGAYLDRKLGTSPLFILIGIGLSLILSGIGIYKKISKLAS